MNSYEQHKQECLNFGFLDTFLEPEQVKAAMDAGLDSHDIYGIECDLQCEAFETFGEALAYYIQRNSEAA